MDYPNDENGFVLRELDKEGVDLTIPRDVDFAHLAPTESEARVLEAQAKELGYTVSVYPPDDEALADGDTEWEVICTVQIVPTHAEISTREQALAELATRCSCEIDGWGFASE